MKIEVFICVWNEIDILEKVIQHHYKYADKVTVLDNYSTDGSAELAYAWNCDVIQYGNKFFDDSENQRIKNNVWKKSEADFVIVCDADECLYLPVDDQSKINTWLWGEKNVYGTSIVRTIGWQVMSNEMPDEKLLEITNGYRFDNYSKFVCFDPKAIQEINFNPGSHRIDPVGRVVYSKDELYLLHYKHIGGVERTIKRYKEYQKRMSKINRQKGWGIHYNQSPSQLRREWDERMKISKPLI